MDKAYMRVQEPPSLLDRVLGHALEAPISLLAMVLSVFLVVNTEGGALMSPLFAALALWHVVLMAGLLGTGGALCLAGILLPLKARDRAWMLEQAGWWVQFPGWWVSALAVAASADHVAVSMAVGVTIGLGGLLRVWALKRVDKTVRHRKDRYDDMVQRITARGDV